MIEKHGCFPIDDFVVCAWVTPGVAYEVGEVGETVEEDWFCQMVRKCRKTSVRVLGIKYVGMDECSGERRRCRAR